MKTVTRIANFAHIYILNVLATSTVLRLLGIEVNNAAFVIFGIGILSGIGIRILDEDRSVLEGSLLNPFQALGLALIAPFQIYKIKKH